MLPSGKKVLMTLNQIQSDLRRIDVACTHYTMMLCMYQVVAVCSTWEQQHTENEVEGVLQCWLSGPAPLLPSLPVKPPHCLPVSISAILLGLTPLHRRQQHNHIILLAHTASQPAESRVNDRVQVVNKKCVRDKKTLLQQVLKCKSTAPIRVHLTLHLAQS